MGGVKPNWVPLLNQVGRYIKIQFSLLGLVRSTGDFTETFIWVGKSGSETFFFF